MGLRPCDLAAVRVQDRIFARTESTGQAHCEAELYYRQARSESMLIAVNCTRPGGTCFCDSMGTGPKATEGFDVAMTELRSGFVMEAGSEDGTISFARIMPPTAQNQKCIEQDLSQMAKQVVDLDDEAAAMRCEHLIRNYDPCISCSVHFLKFERTWREDPAKNRP